MTADNNSEDFCSLCGIKVPKLPPSLAKRNKKRFCSKEHYWESLKVEKIIVKCVICEKSFEQSLGESRKYCSSLCHKNRVNYLEAPCDFCKRTLRIRAADILNKHYCSQKCFHDGRSTASKMVKKCEVCDSAFVTHKKGGGKRTCSRQCAVRLNDPSYFKDMRAALRNSDTKTFISVVKANSIITDKNCWEPKFGSSNPKGYPAFSHDGAQTLHRVISKLIYGKPNDFGQSHHKCTNIKCVNPDHLQWTTPQNNTAEMLSRKEMERYIASLEAKIVRLETEIDLLKK